ncbi:AfsR/SARP family transcriptional regulator [Streptomyces neyagawaensis]|uniref:AfsR/SARP family transcriptional regulator n=1 Tax=Streptomyces neyagawaensis TaxID=42238 RepID=UPI00201D0BC7|nr:AfsR/SARP family transcriptional regulator [Streptomyces neyagawaensis]MCL6731196.1 AfsR/SARP family transcriptional regulator [Streptomyces neyagawaensis]MDE1683681.1 AfsR/SARP family transcriptional regulator [Streptomyces neyagawaensis]
MREALRFEVLGPLRVYRGDEELDLGFPQQRALLALLLVRAGRPVLAGEIVDVLWPGRAPASAMNVVRRYAGALRRLLEPDLPPRAPGRRVLRRAGGYLLEAAEDEVDLLRFRALTKRGKRAAATGRSEAALRHFVDALGDWHGPVAMGIPASVREHTEFAALERELTRTARMAADAALLCGGSELVLPHLRRAVELDPLDESAQAGLVMALAASGLQAEALTAYERARGLLAEELGISPGPELTAAHTRVLRQEWGPPRPPAPARSPHPTPTATVSTAAPTAASASAPTAASVAAPTAVPRAALPSVSAVASTETPVAVPSTAPVAVPVTAPAPPSTPLRPAQLPADLPVFVGREAELGTLLRVTDAAAASTGAPATVLVSGMPGIGKTALAVHWAHRVADRFPDGQLHVSLRGFDAARPPLEPDEALRGMLSALGVPAARMPAGVDSLAGLYRSTLAGRRLLVLLDDAADTEQVRPLLPAGPGSLTLVTSRLALSGLTASGAHPLHLDLPSAADAGAVLARRVGQGRTAAEPGAAAEIVARCGRLPLALAVVAARAADRPDFPLSAIAAELRHAGDGLDAFAGTGGAPDLRAAFDPSYRRLPPENARLFRLLSLRPGADLTPGAAAALAGLPPRRTRLLLDELADAHLVTEHAPGRYVQHALLRLFAAELTAGHDSPTERRAALHRLRTYTAAVPDRHPTSHGDRP